MKTFLIYTFLATLNFVINFLIYNYSFNFQATPYLPEEQRVDSGLLMLETTVPAYIVSAITMSVIFYFIAKRRNNHTLPTANKTH